MKHPLPIGKAISVVSLLAGGLFLGTVGDSLAWDIFLSCGAIIMLINEYLA